ncbi:hypothetical protein [Pseudozobellia sp. WGM2]|uniref:hypothetical protein n=1 Tax=Pseudozobellia sp. WGM2 TaxID=2787625 RepID=UPI001AE0153B|nr:hypothetical protein [Pseudozobellia sp. WGM2]
MSGKVLYIIWQIYILVLFFSCKPDDSGGNNCGLVDCATPLTHSGAMVYFLDNGTDKNSFVSGSLTLDDILITDTKNNAVDIELKQIELHESDLPFTSHFLVIHDDFQPGDNTLNITVKDTLKFTLTLNTIEYTTGCCQGIYLNDVEIEGAAHNLEHSIYLPIIYID